MTKIKSIFRCLPLFLSVLFPLFCSGQLNVMTGGQVGVSTNTVVYGSMLNVVNTGDNPTVNAVSNASTTYQWCYNAQLNQSLGVGYRVEYAGVGNWWVTGAGWMFANGTYYTSDSNLKSNIRPVDSALWKVLQLQGVSYLLHSRATPDSAYKGGPAKMGAVIDSQGQIGYLAQQVQRVLPQLVKTGPYGESAVNYIGIIPLLSEAIKAQQAEIAQAQLSADSQKTTIQNMADSIVVLKSSLQAAKDSLLWQMVQQQFLAKDILNSIRQIRDSLATTYTCNCNSSSGSEGRYVSTDFSGSLYQNSPNPFNNQTTISYLLTGAVQSASINIYNIHGTLMHTYTLSATSGTGSITVAANTLSAGTYIYNLVVNNVQVDSKEMVITN